VLLFSDCDEFETGLFACTVFLQPVENNWYLRYNAAGIPWFTGNPAGLSVLEARSDCGPMDPLTLRSEEGIPLF